MQGGYRSDYEHTGGTSSNTLSVASYGGGGGGGGGGMFCEYQIKMMHIILRFACRFIKPYCIHIAMITTGAL